MAHRPLVLRWSSELRRSGQGIPAPTGIHRINDRVRGEIPPNRLTIIAWGEYGVAGYPPAGEQPGSTPGTTAGAVSATTTVAPSRTRTSSTTRAFSCPGRPHQHSTSTWIRWTSSASSMSRWVPLNSWARRAPGGLGAGGGDRPTARGGGGGGPRPPGGPVARLEDGPPHGQRRQR